MVESILCERGLLRSGKAASGLQDVLTYSRGLVEGCREVPDQVKQ